MSNYYRPRGFGGFSVFPPVIKNLLIINGAVFFLQLIFQNLRTADGVPLENIILRWFALMPLDRGFEFWQLITYQFMHGGFFHILLNMFILWMFGMEIENLWGSKKFLIFYLTAGVVGGLFQILLSPVITGGPFGPTIGASGAIMGVMVAFGMMFPNRLIYVYFLIPVKVKYFIGFLILLEIFAVNDSDSVAHFAHLGGALTGLIYMLINKNRIGNVFGSSTSSNESLSDKFEKFSNKFKKKKDIEEAKYYEIKDKKDEDRVSQEEIDKILDKISQTGYQNLSEKEKKILFDASKKMK